MVSICQHCDIKHKARSKPRFSRYLLLIASASVLSGCYSTLRIPRESRATPPDAAQSDPLAPNANATPLDRVIASLPEQVRRTRSYDPSYVSLDYPNGDVPTERGVCSDVIVRAFRAGGVDLQKEVHEDISRAFSAYPQLWGLRRPDRNIDHRRVPNLMQYFQRRGKARPPSARAKDYQPGDVVAWELRGGRLHIGMVARDTTDQSGRLQIVHNIGAGAKLEDVLFAWKIIGHYRWYT